MMGIRKTEVHFSHRCFARNGWCDMRIEDVPFTVTTWTEVLPTEHSGETRTALRRTLETGNIRIRIVEYAAGYAPDHWCRRGHVVLVLKGELLTEL